MVGGRLRRQSAGAAECVCRLIVGPWPGIVTLTSLVVETSAADVVDVGPNTVSSWWFDGHTAAEIFNC